LQLFLLIALSLSAIGFGERASFSRGHTRVSAQASMPFDCRALDGLTLSIFFRHWFRVRRFFGELVEQIT
jgi:hypothetical protein